MKFLAPLCVALVAASISNSVHAAGRPIKESILGPTAIGEGLRGNPVGFTGTGFEQSEGYHLGPIAGQGWQCSGNCSAIIVAKGNGSAQSVQLSQDTSLPGGTLAGARSATISSVQLDTLNWDFRMDDNGGADYFMLPQTPSQGSVVAYFGYQYTGYMYAVAYTDAAHTNFASIPLGHWNTTWNTYQMKLSQPGSPNTNVTFYAGPDKNHLTQLCALTNGQCSFYPAGNQFEEVLLVSDNYQNTGSGSFTPGGIASGYYDNVVLKPEPASLALLTAGLLLALRRRRVR